MRSPNDEGSQFSKLHFSCNKEERLVLNSFFREYNLYLKKKNNFKPVQGSLSSSQLFVTSPHTFHEMQGIRVETLAKIFTYLENCSIERNRKTDPNNSFQQLFVFLIHRFLPSFQSFQRFPSKAFLPSSLLAL